MAKKRYKKYSTQDKVNYHKNRMYDRSISEDQRLYSRTWLSGFLDNHADHNSKALKNEYSKRKAQGKLYKSEHIMYQADIRGTSERAKLKPKDYFMDGCKGDTDKMISKKFGISKDDLYKLR